MVKETAAIFSSLKTMTIKDLFARKLVQKWLLFLSLSIVIGYLISPKMIFLPTIYNEGDIIRQTLIIEEEMLIPDNISTRLKKEKLLKEQAPIYDFDPEVLTATLERTGSAFRQVRSQYQQLEIQTQEIGNKNRILGMEYFSIRLKQQEAQKNIRFYNTYQKYLLAELLKIEQGGKLTPKDFEKKKKLGIDLRTVSHLLSENQEKLKYYEKESSNYQGRFNNTDEETRTLLRKIHERKVGAADAFTQILDINLDENERLQLDLEYYSKDIENKLKALISVILSKYIVSSKNVLNADKYEKIELHNLVSGEIKQIDTLEAYQGFNGLEEARNFLTSAAQNTFSGDETGENRKLAINLGKKLIAPNVTENKQKFEKKKQDLIENMSPVFFSAKNGEIIARVGDRATLQQVEKINAYYEVVSNIDKLPRAIGIVLIVLLTLTLVSITFQIRGKEAQISFKNLLLLMLSVFITLVLLKGGAVLVELIETRYSELPSQILIYLLPFALCSMLVGILINFEAGLMAGLITSLFASIMMQSNLYCFLYAIMGSIVAALPLKSFESRYSVLQHGLKISAVNLPIVIFIFMVESNQIGYMSWLGVGMALVNGLLTAIIASILLPFLESIFDITTNFKLLELSNMNHPALKELIFNAPGTYQHSVVVGNLAESGASEIGANQLLARVSSYYHDIGKAEEPLYYVENQPINGPNIHDSLDPYESARIIISHLEKGVKKAENYRLGRLIKDIVLQHHGTRLVKFFFDKAQQETEQQDGYADIDETAFRYRGPKPQSIEAALVMLADVSEAASRSLDDPAPETIQSLVKKVCWTVLEDEQLDESGLTLQTFKKVVDIYTVMLISIHHHRIKYPDKANYATEFSLDKEIIN